MANLGKISGRYPLTQGYKVSRTDNGRATAYGIMGMLGGVVIGIASALSIASQRLPAPPQGQAQASQGQGLPSLAIRAEAAEAEAISPTYAQRIMAAADELQQAAWVLYHTNPNQGTYDALLRINFATQNVECEVYPQECN